jgi:hypothetical protein
MMHGSRDYLRKRHAPNRNVPESGYRFRFIDGKAESNSGTVT